jgi:hypothetical protein
MRRLIWSILAVTAVCCVIAGIALSIGFAHGETTRSPTGDYIRLVILCITFWGPMYLLIVWWITVPVIIVVGVLIACVHRTPGAGGAVGGR